ncbi:MAG: 2-oxoglutarate dehydrogenase E1 component [Alphaproteobacteria bacterium]|nr:2-oxoglutarate dehydrogenase E1 component [Alphaproteobacteria bacterium]OJV46588.1 MAG: 2-oxoglutarate dehydrogenase E1 component [Alphaproteobacteria bacterium 43-37]
MSQKFSSLFSSADVHYLSALYEKYKQDPRSVEPSLAAEFKKLDEGSAGAEAAQDKPSWIPAFRLELTNPLEEDLREIKDKKGHASKDGKTNESSVGKAVLAAALKVAALVEAYRRFGHMAVPLDPLHLKPVIGHVELTPEFHGITPDEMNLEVELPLFGFKTALVKDVIRWAEATYASRIGFDFSHITDLTRRQWLQHRVESTYIDFSKQDQIEILKGLTKADLFERFLAVKFPGAKRFGLEGGDSLIPLLEFVLQYGAHQKLSEVVIGMAHRGRLSVLTNVMDKPYAAVLSEFKYGIPIHRELGSAGDVKYHMGASTDRIMADHTLHLTLMPNPSHLEAVNPVAMGKVRARQDEFKTQDAAMCVLIHGDAAFPGQGVVAECLAMSELKGFSIGGTYHIIINNQVGFTTNPDCSRSTYYSSDLAKGFDMPIFHVNGDDPEAVVFAGQIAAEYRAKFSSDVIIDLVCYRRHGHNEGDEPVFTQPKMYGIISNHPTPRIIYADKLVQSGVITQAMVEEFKTQFEQQMQKAFDETESYKSVKPDWLEGRWSHIKTDDDKSQPVTGLDLKKLQSIGEKLFTVPSHFNLNPKIARQIEQKKQMLITGKELDWGTGEALAFASLVAEGRKVRLTGQDSQRGTFSHRHAVLTDQVTEETYTPIHSLTAEKELFEVTNSLLSEASVVGYEYGYAYNSPDALVLWEGQFGDFANGAQVYMDQFISAGESKWLRKNGIVLLLPHGYEGQGPEHSSARLERYLQLCAGGNMRVVNCTTPANFFHALRRQLHSQTRKPLVVMTPKSLLRHKQAVSDLAEFGSGKTFRPVIADANLSSGQGIERIVITSGKVYYDLKTMLDGHLDKKIALIRLEQYHPFPEADIVAALKSHTGAQVIWCQEEPQNMGAWTFVRPYLEKVLEALKFKHALQYVGRPAEASPAVGSDKVHAVEQQRLVEEALNI